jgi:hypothetical protein
MLIRLLVAVLTLGGPTPFRTCTCAAHADHTPPSEDRTGLAADAHCAPARGAHHAPAGDRSTGPTCDGEHHPAQHEPDCPAAGPRPPAQEAVQRPEADAPSDCAPACATAWVPAPLDGLGTSAPPPAPPRAAKYPLYLMLLALRN